MFTSVIDSEYLELFNVEESKENIEKICMYYGVLPGPAWIVSANWIQIYVSWINPYSVYSLQSQIPLSEHLTMKPMQTR